VRSVSSLLLEHPVFYASSQNWFPRMTAWLILNNSTGQIVEIFFHLGIQIGKVLYDTKKVRL
jgi:hypothetical protein